ncbi:nucleotidyltransferase family protein [Candidatus Poriferisodalis sp.]|uniref:nucleotidyltransferase family protein n=1 Tax=Candidatus Poriferisodalis sp. TaxID=3101277 RepID=UPI003D101499
MTAALADHTDAVKQLCKRFNVLRLDLFGSAARGSFDPDRSDLDFLVDFQPVALDDYSNTYFGLLEALEDLFDRSVDLVVRAAIKNPYFLEAVETTRIPVYEA